MSIGERLRQARLEAGLSQRSLCENIITRNMLSQIENGSAVPSVQTLQLLAEKLRRPVGYFFGEESRERPDSLEKAWKALAERDPERAEACLEAAVRPGAVEERLLKDRILLAKAEKAAREDRKPYALSLLAKLRQPDQPELERRKLLLSAELEPEKAPALVKKLPSLDRELMIRARAVLDDNPRRAGELLDAAEDHQSPDWAFLRGLAWQRQQQYEQAARCFHVAEKTYPRETARELEICYRELEDFKQAYYYACCQKQDRS